MIEFIREQLQANPARIVGYASSLAVAGAIQVARQFGLELDAQAQAAISLLTGLVITELIRRFVFSPKTTQAIANASTFEEAGTQIDIGNPPKGE